MKLGFYDGKFVAENLNYAGVVTRLLQPILPVFFAVQFAFLYDGWDNKWSPAQLKIGAGLLLGGLTVLALFSLTVGSEVALLGAGVETLVGVEAVEVASGGSWFVEQQAVIQEFLNTLGQGLGL
jgi:zeaxanthin epoxidase